MTEFPTINLTTEFDIAEFYQEDTPPTDALEALKNISLIDMLTVAKIELYKEQLNLDAQLYADRASDQYWALIGKVAGIEKFDNQGRSLKVGFEGIAYIDNQAIDYADFKDLQYLATLQRDQYKRGAIPLLALWG